MLTIAQRSAVADQLHRAERDRVPVDPVVALFPEMDVVDAYEIQLLNIRRRLGSGAPGDGEPGEGEPGDVVVGHKVGLSSPVMQRMMGVDEPDYGHLLERMRLSEDVAAPLAGYCYPRIEVEVAYVLADDLPGEGCTEADVLAATESLAPAIELIDSRIRDWKISLPDTIADNASSASFVLGSARVDPSRVDPTGIDAVLRRNGEHIADGRSDAVLGDPTTAVAWLARKVADFGVRLRAGNVVLPGSCTRAVDVHAGDTFSAELTGLGSVSLSFDRGGF